MKTKISNYKYFLFAAFLALFVSGCSEMLDNPLKDKDTGEDINLLIVDFNFFDIRMTYKLLDVSTGETVENEATIWFTGENADDVVTYAGEKESEHITSLGQLELTIDPNVETSASSPISFTVHVEADGYQDFSQTIQISSEGTKTFELYLSPISGGDEDVIGGEDDDDSFTFSVLELKSTLAEKAYSVNYSILKSDMINFKDENGSTLYANIEELMADYNENSEGFLELTVDIKTGFPGSTENVSYNGSTQTALFQKLETGDLVSLSVGGRTVADLNGGIITQTCTYTSSPEPDLFGFANVENDSWTISSEPQVYSDLDISYTLASASLDELCTTGASITFASNAVSSFSIDADIYNTAGTLILTRTFTGDFPESFVLENVPSTAATIQFRQNNPAFSAIDDLEITNLCSGTYEVDVDAAEGYNEYLVILKALCEENTSVAIAPTYSGEMRIKGSSDEWQGIDMDGGQVNVLAKENEEYEIRLLWEDAWETTSFFTEFDADGNYINESSSNVSSELMDDGRIKILIEHTFEQDICDDLGW